MTINTNTYLEIDTAIFFLNDDCVTYHIYQLSSSKIYQKTLNGMWDKNFKQVIYMKCKQINMLKLLYRRRSEEI